MATKTLSLFTAIAATAVLIASIGCQRKETGTAREETTPRVSEAVCVLHPTEGNAVTGTVTFTDTPEGVKVVADIRGLTPGKHGFHIHEFGDCSASDAASAGGHYAPRGMPHAGPNDERRHVGDLGNVTADSTGVAHYEWVDPVLSLNGEYSIVGRAVVVHADEDDLISQPSGASGPRVACGVIGLEGKS